MEGEGGGEGVVLVEHHAPEAERPEPAPVDGAEVGDGDVGKGQPRVAVAGDYGGASRDALQIQPLAQRLLGSAHLRRRREAHPALHSSYHGPTNEYEHGLEMINHSCNFEILVIKRII